MHDLRPVALVLVFGSILVSQLVTETNAIIIPNNDDGTSQSFSSSYIFSSSSSSSSSSFSSSYSSSSSSSSSTSTLQRSYILVAPSFVRPGMNYSIGVNLAGESPSSMLSAFIEANGTLVAKAEHHFENDKSALLSIKIPFDAPISLFYDLTVKCNGSSSFSTTRRILLYKKTLSFFIQTDKSVYKQGDLVQFRAFALYANFKVYQNPLSVTIYDASLNKVHEWLNDTNQLDGLLSGDFTLPTRPLYGMWTIKVAAEGQSYTNKFMIMEYVKPLFEVSLSMPSYAISAQEEIVFNIMAKFDTGKPVDGKLHLFVKLVGQNSTIEETNNAEDLIDIQLPFSDGLSPIAIPMMQVRTWTGDLGDKKLFVVATITDEITGKASKGNGSVNIYNSAERIEFSYLHAKRFKPTLDYSVTLKLTQPDGRPVIQTDAVVLITTVVTLVDHDGPPPTASTAGNVALPNTYRKTLPGLQAPVPFNGILTFPIVAEKHAIAMEISAIYKTSTISMNVQASYSPSYSFLQLYLAEERNYQVGDKIAIMVQATEALTHYTYQVSSKGVLLNSEMQFGYHSNSTKFFITATTEMVPAIRVMAFYTRPDGEIVADSFHLQVQGNLFNEVQLSIDETEVHPGNEIATYVIADSGSRFYLHAIDQRVHYDDIISEITRDEMYVEMNAFDPIWSIEHEGETTFDDHSGSSSGKDVTETFWNSGFIVMTDYLFYNYDSPYESQTGVSTGGASGAGVVKSNQQLSNGLGRVWTHFPESWLWADFKTCANGEGIYFVNVPKTITSWMINGYAINKETGFGMPIGPSSLSVFKRFLLVANYPTFPIVLGEQVGIEIIIFNYMSVDQKFKVTLPKRYDTYTNIHRDCNGIEYKTQQDQVVYVMARSGQIVSVYFAIIPHMLGTIDIRARAQSDFVAEQVVGQIKVVPPGSAFTYNIPVLIDLTGEANEFQRYVNISTHSDVVEGSQHMKVAAFGDLLGPSILGLASLVDLPTACGEQTMLELAPNVFITDYLRQTMKLTGDLKIKALKLMQIGYQQELRFRHRDGSFSAFGSKDNSGSMWLTAFVARVFHQSSSYMYIQESIIKEAINWIVKHQYENGSFPEPGRVIDKNLQSQSGTGDSLTAFVFLTLLETEALYDNTTEEGIAFIEARTKALNYLETSAVDSTDLYFLTIVSYALQLADSTSADAVLDRVVAKTTRQDTMVYWHHPDAPKATTGTWHKPNPATSIDIEMTSYVLATFALREDITFGHKIFQWLIRQRNAQGGFASTQDTVVAFMAMSLYAQLVYTDDVDMKIYASMDTGEGFTFQINKRNALINQRRETNKIPFYVTIDAQGSGRAMLELTVYFNVEKEIEDTNFDLKIKIVTETKNFLYIETCTRWLGSGSSSGMAVQEIGIPSGFEPDRDAIDQLDGLKLSEVYRNKLELYFDEITKDEMCIKIPFNRTALIGKNKPSYIKIFDYYEPSNQVTQFFSSNILSQISICDVCTKCHGCEEVVAATSAPLTLEEEDDLIEKEMSGTTTTTKV